MNKIFAPTLFGFPRLIRLAAALCLALSPLAAQVISMEERADRYLDAYMMSNEAERLEKAGRLDEALRTLQEAAPIFDSLARLYPDWQPPIMEKRRRTVRDAIARVQTALQRPPQAAAPAQPAAASAPATQGGAEGPPAIGSWGAGGGAPPASGAGGVPSLTDFFQEYERQVKEQMDALQRRNLEMEGALRKWDDWYRWASKEIQAARAEKETLAGQITNMEGNIQQMQREVEAGRASQDQLDLLLKEKAALLALEKQNNQRLLEAQTAAAEAAEKLTATSRQLEALTEERDRLKAERDAAIEERDAAMAGKVQAEAELAGMKNNSDADALKKLADENQRLKNEMETAKAEVAKARQENEEIGAALAAENEMLRGVILRQLRGQASQQQAKAELIEELQKLDNAPDDLLAKARELETARLTLTEAEERLFTDPQVQEMLSAGSGAVQATLIASGETNGPAKAGTDAPAGGEPDATTTPAADLLKKADEAVRKKDFPTAVRHLKEAAKADPDNTAVLVSLGDAHLRAGQFKEAETVLQKCLALDSKNAAAHHVLGMTYFRSTQLEKARGAFEAALKLDPKQALGHHYLGIIANRLKQSERAEKEFRKALEINPQFGEAHFNLAVLYVGWDPPQWDKARLEYESALGKGVPPDQNLEKLLKQ